MFRLVSIFVFILALASLSFATSITVSSFSFGSWTFGGSTATVRLYPNKTFVTSDSATILAGTASGFYKTINCTVSAGTVSCNSVAIDSTTNSSVKTVKYIADIYDSAGRVRGRWMEAFSVPTSLGTTVTWAQLRTYNAAPATSLPVTYYTADQVNALITTGGATFPTNTLVGRASPGTGAPESITLGTNLTLSGTTLNAAGGGSAVESLVASSSDLDTLITTANANSSNRYNALLTTNATISAAKTVPSNIFIEPMNGSKFVKSGSGSITFQGAGIIGSPYGQIFSGFAAGDIQWTGPYPDFFRLEWFGGVADDDGSSGTDNLAAFNAVQAAMQRIYGIGGRQIGGTIKLREGGRYFFSGTLNVRRGMRIDGGSFGYTTANVYLRWPANTQGIILHGLSTFDHTMTTESAEGSELKGFGMIGAKGADNTVLSTSGLTFTLTGGTYTQVDASGSNDGTVASVPAGTTISLNGFEYVVSFDVGSVPTSTVPILAPRMSVTLTAARTITPGVYGAFPSNNDWAGSTITFREPQGRILGTYTILSNTTTSLTTTADTFWTSGALVVEMEISGLKVMAGQTARLNIYHGIDVRKSVKLSELNIVGFAGDGVELNSNKAPSTIPDTEPNQNNSYLERIFSQDNAGNGFKFYGVNTNNLSTLLLDAENNRGYGVFEQGTAGANHFGWHISTGYQGAFSMTGAIARNMVIACYTEGGQPAGLAGQGTTIFGGNHGAGVRDTFVYGQTLTQYRNLDSFNTTHAWMFGIGPPGSPDGTLAAFGGGDEAANLASGGTNSTITGPSYYLRYDISVPGSYTWNHSSSAGGGASTPAFGLTGSNASIGGGQFFFGPNGFRTGSYDAGPWAFDPKVSHVIPGTVAIDPASINANTVSTQTFTVTGAATGDHLTLNVPAAGLTAGLIVLQTTVSAANTISITFMNTTGAPIDQASGTWGYLLLR